jgi:anti-sigma factor RsiW
MVQSTDDNRDSLDLLVHAYLDGELDVASGVAIQQRIDSDPFMAKQAADIQALKEVLRANFPTEAIPPHLEARVDRLHRKRLNAYRPTWGSMAAAVLVTLALASTSTWVAQRAITSDPQTSELLDGHLRSLVAQQTTDVASSDRHTVKPWFNGKVAQSPRVKDLSEAGFPLVGGRIDVLNKVNVPTLVYNRRRHVISVTAAPVASGGPSEEAIHGFNVLRWVADGMSYWAISDLNAAELNEFVRLYRE